MKKSLLLILTFLVCSLVYAGDTEETLWNAARSGDLETIKKLVAAGVDVNAKTKYNATALAYACDKGHIDIVRYLLDRGAEVNTTDNFYDFTPIGWAGFNEHVAIIELLLDHGATGADEIAVACPFCYVMLDDGIKELGVDEQVTVKEISVILAERVLE